MKINKTNEFDQISKVRRSDVQSAGKKQTAAGETKIAGNEDKLEFSSRAAEVGNLVDELKNMPEVRQERVDALREKIAAGEFNPGSDEIADAILKDEG